MMKRKSVKKARPKKKPSRHLQRIKRMEKAINEIRQAQTESVRFKRINKLAKRFNEITNAREKELILSGLRQIQSAYSFALAHNAGRLRIVKLK